MSEEDMEDILEHIKSCFDDLPWFKVNGENFPFRLEIEVTKDNEIISSRYTDKPRVSVNIGTFEGDLKQTLKGHLVYKAHSWKNEVEECDARCLEVANS